MDFVKMSATLSQTSFLHSSVNLIQNFIFVDVHHAYDVVILLLKTAKTDGNSVRFSKVNTQLFLNCNYMPLFMLVALFSPGFCVIQGLATF